MTCVENGDYSSGIAIHIIERYYYLNYKLYDISTQDVYLNLVFENVNCDHLARHKIQ